MQISRQDLLELRDSQLNVFASLAVYAGVWAIFQVLLSLFDVDMALVQIFDRYGNFSLPGILVALLLVISAFVPHWVLLRRSRLTWRQAARMIRELREEKPVPAEEDPDWVRRAPRPSPVDVPPGPPTVETAAESDDYWQQRWQEFIHARGDDDLDSRD